jgi:predicted alpha/beta hydrolase family esterase
MQNHVFILPGLNNSGPQHWQTHWEEKYGFIRINQSDWDTPVREDWINTIDETISKYPLDKVILIGHSLACSATVFWFEKFRRKIKGALLVGPSDTEAPSYPPGTTGFKPMPLTKLEFPSIVIASSNDDYVTLDRAKFFAGCWGSELINAGPVGHINSSSNLGSWEGGYEVLKKLMSDRS